MEQKKTEYLTTREAAELLGVAVSTIQIWTNDGVLRAWTTNGGHRRIECSSVEELIRSRQSEVSQTQEKRILSVVLVEDNTQQLLLYTKQFKAWNINISVETASDGYHGLVTIGKTLPDVIISDLKMPNMDGFQMIRALNEQPELVKTLIIVITGLTKDEISARGGLPDAVKVFTKPASFHQLENLLHEKAAAREVNLWTAS